MSTVAPQWIGKTDAFWYAARTATGTRYWKVDPAKKEKVPLFDHIDSERFEVFAARAEPPAGLLAYRDGQPVGWCAIGPRARYPKVLRSPLWKGRDSAEDESVWLVPCFFVRRTARRSGVVRALLAAAVELASKHGAPAIEGFPRSGADRVDPASAYVGAEPVFASLGFTPTRRPNERRVVMRREL